MPSPHLILSAWCGQPIQYPFKRLESNKKKYAFFPEKKIQYFFFNMLCAATNSNYVELYMRYQPIQFHLFYMIPAPKDCMHKICRQRCVQHPVPDSYVCRACFYFYELYVNKIIEKCKGHSRTKSIWNVILPQNLVLFLAHLSRRPWFALGMWPEMAPPWAAQALALSCCFQQLLIFIWYQSSSWSLQEGHPPSDVNHLLLLRVCHTVCVERGYSAGNLLGIPMLMPSWPCCPMWASLSIVKLTTTIDWVYYGSLISLYHSFFIVWDFALQWIGPGPETRAFL